MSSLIVRKRLHSSEVRAIALHATGHRFDPDWRYSKINGILLHRVHIKKARNAGSNDANDVKFEGGEIKGRYVNYSWYRSSNKIHYLQTTID